MKNKKYSLFLDDLRTPPKKVPVGKNWVVMRSYEEAVEHIKNFGMPTFISFDHDLGIGNTGHDFAKFLVESDLDGNELPKDFDYLVHSANNVGGPNIDFLLRGYLKFKDEESKTTTKKNFKI